MTRSCRSQVEILSAGLACICHCPFVSLCLYALPPRKTRFAKQVPARRGHLVELHVKSDRHQSAFVLLCLCAFRKKINKDFKVGPTMHSANDTIKSLCLCAIVPLCLAPQKTKTAKQVPARCGQLVELLLKSDRHSSAFVGLCLCAFGQKKVYKHFIVGPTMQSANDQIRFQNGRFWWGAGSRTGGSGGGRVPGQGLCQRFWGRVLHI